MTDEQIPTFGGDGYEERIKQWDKEKKGLIGDLQSERQRRQALEERLELVEKSLTSAGEDDGEKPEDRVNRLAQDPDMFIANHLVEFEEKVVKPLRQEVTLLNIDRKIEKALRWVAKQEKKDVEEVEGSDLENRLAQITTDLRNRGVVLTDPYEGTKQAYKIYLQEKREEESREKEREGKIQENRTESVTVQPRSGSRRWTRAEIDNLSIEEFTANETEINRQLAQGLIK